MVQPLAFSTLMSGIFKESNGVTLERGIRWMEVILWAEGEEIVEGLGNFILEEGAGGMVVEEASSPFTAKLRAFFQDDSTAMGKINRLKSYIDSLKALFPANSIAYPSFQPINDRDWLEAYRKSYKGTRVTDRIVVMPSWERGKKRKIKEEIIIEIDPGMAFGTGLHPSTRLCLRALEERFGSCPKRRTMRVLDVGSGSGILSIAAAKMGAIDVLAMDIDPEAARVAMANVLHNGCGDRVKILVGDISGIKGRFDLVVANITESVHEENAALYRRRLTDRGYLILSGILKEREGKLCDFYIRKGYSLRGTKETEGWSSLVFTKEDLSEG
jgi:ribosomal protein L11 methyltransferase